MSGASLLWSNMSERQRMTIGKKEEEEEEEGNVLWPLFLPTSQANPRLTIFETNEGILYFLVYYENIC